jgi:hypothetical protein
MFSLGLHGKLAKLFAHPTEKVDEGFGCWDNIEGRGNSGSFLKITNP